MASNPETLLTKRIVGAISLKYGEQLYWVKNHGNMYTRKGVPDLTIQIGPVVVWLEVKTPKGKLSEHQAAQLSRINNAGGTGAVVRSVKEALEATEQALEKAKQWAKTFHTTHSSS